MGPRIKRESTLLAGLSLTTSATSSAEIDITNYASGEIFIPTGSTITSLTWYAAPQKGGTYLAAQDASGSAVVQTVAAAKAYPIPAVLFGASSLRAVSDAAGTAAVSLKA